MSEKQNKIENGDVLTFEGKAVFSRIVQWWSGSPISHIGVAYYLPVNGTRYLCSIEAMEGKGLRIVPLHLIWGEYVNVWVQKHDQNPIEVVDRMVNLLNDRYANKKQFLLMASKLWRWVRTKIGFPIDTSRTSWHCAEAVAYCLDFKEKPQCLFTPAEISNLLKPPRRVHPTELAVTKIPDEYVHSL